MVGKICENTSSHESVIPEFAHDIFFEIIGAVVVFRFRSVVGSAICKHPLHIGNIQAFVAIIVGFESFRHGFLKGKKKSLVLTSAHYKLRNFVMEGWV